MFGIDDVFAGGVSLLGGVISNVMSGNRQEDAQKFQADQALKSREWQEFMSNTAYQRGMRDMEAAGLNPILAYQRGGASSPTGATAAGVTPMPVHDVLSPAVSTALQSRQLNAQLNNLYETNFNIKQDTMKKVAETTAITEDAARIKSDTAIKNQVLISAIAEAAKAKTDVEFWSSPAGRMARLLGLGGREAGAAISPVTDVLGSTFRGVGTFNQRWQALHDRGF